MAARGADAKLVVHATEVAAVLGPNRYRDPLHAIFERIWRRHNPRALQPAASGCGPSNAPSNACAPVTHAAGQDASASTLHTRSRLCTCRTFRIRTQDRQLLQLLALRERHNASAAADADADADAEERREAAFRKQWGVALERHVLAWYHHLRTQVDHEPIRDIFADPQHYALQLGRSQYSPRVQFWVRGRLDGVQLEADGQRTVLEVKSRMNAPRAAFLDHEYVQLQTYLQLTGLRRGCLIDSFVARAGAAEGAPSDVVELELNVLQVQRDASLWTYWIRPRLQGLLEFLLFLNEHVGAAAYYRSLAPAARDAYLNFVLQHIKLPPPPAALVSRDASLLPARWSPPTFQWAPGAALAAAAAPSPEARARAKRKQNYAFDEEERESNRQWGRIILALPFE